MNDLNTDATKVGGKLYYRGAGWFFGKDSFDADEQRLHTTLMDNVTAWMEDEKDEKGKYPTPKEIYTEYRRLGVTAGVKADDLVDMPTTFPKAPPVAKAPPKRDDPLYVGIDDDAKFDSVAVGTRVYLEVINDYAIKERD